MFFGHHREDSDIRVDQFCNSHSLGGTFASTSMTFTGIQTVNS